MTSSAGDELSEALTRLYSERDEVLGDVATLERDLGEKHRALADMNEKIEAMEKTLAVLRPDLVQEVRRPAPTEERGEEGPADEAAPEPRRATDFSHLPLQGVVLGIIAGAASSLHEREIADIVKTPEESVSPHLSHLKYRDLVEPIEPGRYRLAAMLPIETEQEVSEAIRLVATAIVDDQQWDILDAVFEMDERLPFVGFEHFRRNRLAGVTGSRWANDRLTHAIMKELLTRELIEVYHTDNPRNPDFPTAAIRLTAEGLDEIED